MHSHRNREFLVLFLILCLLATFIPMGEARANGAPVITPGVNPGAVIDSEAMFLSFSNGPGVEILLGAAGLPDGQRAQVDFSGGVACDGSLGTGAWLPSNHVTLDYSYALGKLILEVAASSRYCLEYVVGQPSPLDYLQLDVVNGSEDGAASFNNVRLNGILLGDFAGIGENSWNFTGLDYSLGFRLEGDLVLTGPQPDGNVNHVGFKLGYLQADNQGPLTGDVKADPNPVYLNGPVVLSALVDDQATGGSAVGAAEYSLDDGMVWQAMAASDGAFDQPLEAVTATFTATSIQLTKVCVRGTDARGNIGEMTCTEISVLYQFEGFFRPVQMGVINNAKAGQTIPIKWQLNDAAGVLVTDRRSFEGLYSYPVDCKTWIGDLSQAVQEYSTNSKGLMLTEGGRWQYKWKTPKEYAGTCRIMFVQLAGGVQSPTLQLKFR